MPGLSRLRPCHPILIALLLGLGSAVGPIQLSQAQEFRIDTEIFIGDEKQPTAETLTIFSQGMIYDFLLEDNGEIIMLDTVRGRFTLLDPALRIKCGLSTDDVLQRALVLETHAAQSKDPLFMFAAAPKFESNIEEYQENGQQLVRLHLTAKPMEYVAIARRPEQSGAVAAFRYFADQFARLNALRPGNLPPGARLELNKALVERKLIPLEITRTIPAAKPLGGKLVARSRHLVNWTLSGEDRKKIDLAGTYNAQFAAVGFEAYRAPAGKVAGKTAGK